MSDFIQTHLTYISSSYECVGTEKLRCSLMTQKSSLAKYKGKEADIF